MSEINDKPVGGVEEPKPEVTDTTATANVEAADAVADKAEPEVQKCAETAPAQDEAEAPAVAPSVTMSFVDIESITSQLKLDLVNLAFKHLQLCFAVDTFPKGGLYDSPYVTNAIKRYERCWLPLMAKVKPQDLEKIVAPVDIAWVWHMHRMDPEKYRLDCEALVGKVVDVPTEATFSFSDGRDTQFKKFTAHVWAKQTAYGYFPPKLGPDAFSKTHKSTADIHNAAQRHGPLVHQVLRALYLQKPFLQRAVERYARFIMLAKENPDVELVLPMDVDFIWRTHTSVHQVYMEEMTNLLGGLPKFADWTRAEVGKLDKAFKATEKLWTEKFSGVQFMTNGCQFIPEKLPHPAQHLVAKSVKRFYNDMAWRAGGHALHVLFLMAEGRAHNSKKKNEADVRLLTGRYVTRHASQFQFFENLPFSSEHRLFKALALSDTEAVMELATPIVKPLGPKARPDAKRSLLTGSEYHSEWDTKIFGAVNITEDDGMLLEGGVQKLEKADAKIVVEKKGEASADKEGEVREQDSAADGDKIEEASDKPEAEGSSSAGKTARPKKAGIMACFRPKVKAPVAEA